MRTVLVLVVLLLLAPETLAGGSVWDQKKVVVYDATSEDWRPRVEGKVAEFNAILPKGAPRLVYRPVPVSDCLESDPQKGAIVVCSTDAALGEEDGAPIHGIGQHHIVDGRITWAKVMLHNDAPVSERDRYVCQEMGHVVLGMPERHDVPEIPSCVWGLLAEPGPLDIAFAKRIYRKHGHHR